MITIRPTKAGKEYINNQSELAEKGLLSQCGGNEDKSVAKLMKSAIKLLEKTQNEKNTTDTNSVEEVNFLIVNKLAQIVPALQAVSNSLSQIHQVVKEPIEAINPEPTQNALAEVHAKSEEQPSVITEVLKEVVEEVTEVPDGLNDTPEELPTHLGNIELEKEEENK